MPGSVRFSTAILCTGARRSEIFNLARDDVNFEHRMITPKGLHAGNTTKTKKPPQYRDRYHGGFFRDSRIPAKPLKSFSVPNRI